MEHDTQRTTITMEARDKLSYDACQILGCADLYARKHATRVVLFSDLTRMFASAGHSRAGPGVDWQAALGELRIGPYPAMFLTITERAHLLICDPSEARTEDERNLVRQAIVGKLAVDWPLYLRRLISAGRAPGAGR